MTEPNLFHELAGLTTESRNPRSMQIDVAPIDEVLRVIHEEDARVIPAVGRELSFIAQAVGIVVRAFKAGGRLFYFGAGTSGRLGVLDAAECPPTFGTPHEMVQGVIAGGPPAMFRAQEGAEDHEGAGAAAIQDAGVSSRDVVCGIAASRRTPFVVGAVREAHRIGSPTIFITCNPRSQFDMHDIVNVAICADVGPEVIMGSTRMKSGTAQKLVLNMITTTAMVQLGKTYENMMVDLQMTNEKLKERSKKIVMTVTGVGYAEAAEALNAAGGHVKTAIVMILGDCSAPVARKRLRAADGFVRRALQAD